MDDPKASTPRGIRNNNPGNVRVNPSIVWRGQSGVDPDGFLVFNADIMGIRCMAMVLRHYNEYYGCVRLADYIRRWAPPSENDTVAYVDAVARSMGIAPDDIIDLHRQGADLVRAIILHENGEQPYGDDVIAEGIRLSHIQ